MKESEGKVRKDVPVLYNSRNNWEMAVIPWLGRLRQGDQKCKIILVYM